MNAFITLTKTFSLLNMTGVQRMIDQRPPVLENLEESIAGIIRGSRTLWTEKENGFVSLNKIKSAMI